MLVNESVYIVTELIIATSLKSFLMLKNIRMSCTSWYFFYYLNTEYGLSLFDKCRIDMLTLRS